MKHKILLSWFLFYLSAGVAQAAQDYNLREVTPEIQQAIQARQSRYAELQTLKQKGIVGENNQGFVSVLNGAPGADPLASAENQDRNKIYQAIAVQNNLGPEGISEVKRIFAEVQRGKAQPGDSIQLPSGEWVQK